MPTIRKRELNIARKSIQDLNARLENVSIKDHYGLVSDLQHTNYHDVFDVAWSSLNDKLSRVWEGLKGIEVTSEDGEDDLRELIFTKTGLDLDNRSPHEGFRAIMNEVANMRM